MGLQSFGPLGRVFFIYIKGGGILFFWGTHRVSISNQCRQESRKKTPFWPQM